MAIKTGQAMRDYARSPQREYHVQYSLVHITLKNGQTVDFTITAGPSVLPHLVSESVKTGFISLFNDNDNLAVCVHDIQTIEIRPLDKQP